VLDGPASLFASQFGIAESQRRSASGESRIEVAVPDDLTAFVTSIVVLARPG
jgi:hypothetical protein